MTLKELRMSRGLSVQKLAKELGVSYSALYNWEHGYANPTEKLHTKLISFFGETPTDIKVGIQGTLKEE